MDNFLWRFIILESCFEFNWYLLKYSKYFEKTQEKSSWENSQHGRHCIALTVEIDATERKICLQNFFCSFFLAENSTAIIWNVILGKTLKLHPVCGVVETWENEVTLYHKLPLGHPWERCSTYDPWVGRAHKPCLVIYLEEGKPRITNPGGWCSLVLDGKSSRGRKTSNNKPG